MDECCCDEDSGAKMARKEEKVVRDRDWKLGESSYYDGERARWLSC